MTLLSAQGLWGWPRAPNVLGLMFFFGIPVLMAFGTSFNEWNGIKPPRFIGVDNFERMPTTTASSRR